MPDTRQLQLLGLFVLLVGGSWWLARQTPESVPYQPTPHSPDYIVEQFNITEMGLDGRPDKRLTGERMLHFPDDDSTELTRPMMTVYDGQRPPWQIRSETGWLSGDRELLLLQGQVNIDRAAAPGVRPLQLVTRDLRVQPEQNYAETDADVFSRSRADWVVSKGMQAWLAKPIRVKLLSNVRGLYDIKQRETAGDTAPAAADGSGRPGV